MSLERVTFPSMKHVLFATGLAVTMASLQSQTPAPQPAQPAVPGAMRQLNASFAGVFEKISPSVVVIEASRAGTVSVPGLPRGLEFFLQRPDGSPVLDQPNIGSGFVFQPDGHILTNFHVIEGAEKIVVRLKDGRKFDATVKGGDERSDLAVIKIDGNDLPVAELGDSDAVKVGEFAFAIGTPMDLPYTFTVGVVSAKGRNLQIGNGYDFIQTDASINPGNSGGPLCDIDGRVVGINALISGTNRGLGFSIPINTAKAIAAQLMERGRVSRPWLGISIAGLEESEYLQQFFPGLSKGVVVKGIETGAPAESSGLRAGDVIIKVDGREVAVAGDLQHEILGKNIGQKVELDIWRSGNLVKLAVMTGEQPDPIMRASTRPRRNRQQHPDAARQPVPQPSSPGLSLKDADQEALREFGIRRQASGGALVSGVEPGSPAAVAGIEKGDIITEAGGRPVQGKNDLEEILKSLDPDRGVLLLLERGNRRTFAILKP